MLKLIMLNTLANKKIGVMELLALFRATYKDYIDLYYILKKFELSELLKAAEAKHPEFDKTIYLRALLSYDDVDKFPIAFAQGFNVARSSVFNFIESKTVKYLKENE